MNKRIRLSGFAVLAALWLLLVVFAWFSAPTEISEAERRPLAQFPKFTVERLLDGSFMRDFSDYSLDQFPLRDTFRQVKALFHYNALNQSDNNNIYIADGYAVKQEYPLNETSVNHALNRLNFIYNKYLTDSKVYMAIVPDKGYYLAEENGQLSLDYSDLYTMVESGMPWATHVDLTGYLTADSFYRTDTHWRQEMLLPAAGALCDALGVTPPQTDRYRQMELSRPFYGVYYGQAALPMEPDTIRYLESDLLKNCTVTNFETGKTASVYDMDKLTSRDLYDVFLSGACALLTIENPQAATNRELIVFRDSFGSSMIPLLLQDYAKVTVIDIRYVSPDFLGQLVDFHGQDVLMLYSTLVLNNSSVLR